MKGLERDNRDKTMDKDNNFATVFSEANFAAVFSDDRLPLWTVAICVSIRVYSIISNQSPEELCICYKDELFTYFKVPGAREVNSQSLSSS